MKPNLMSIILLILCEGLFALASDSVIAQTEYAAPAQASKASESPSVDPCFSTHSSGIGVNKLSICITDRGNIFNFESPDGYEHLTPLGDGLYPDGYVLCSALRVHGYNSGTATYESGWGAPTISQPRGPNTLPLTITRSTTDRRFELTQTFSWNVAEKEVTITMTVKNISAAAISDVKLARYFDGDIDNRFPNLYDVGADSVWARRDGGVASSRHGLSLTALSLAQPHKAVIEKLDEWAPTGSGARSARTCTPVEEPTAPPDSRLDYIGRLTYDLGTINAGISKTVKVIYKRL